MATVNFTTNLALALPTTGDLSGTWGTAVNTGISELVDQALGYQAFTATGGSDTLTIPDAATGVARSIYIQLNGTGGGTVNVPTTKTKMYFVFNNTSSAITFKVTGQTGVSIPAAAKIALVSNGTDVIPAVNYFSTAISAAANTGSMIPFYYADQLAFPSAASSHGAIAHSHADGAMFFAHGGSWVRMLDGAYTTTATAGGTTTLTASSAAAQFFTGTSAQTIVLPVASTLTLGQTFSIHNNSTSDLTVNSSGSNLVATVTASTTCLITCILTSGTSAASFDADFTGFTSTLPIARGGTGLSTLTANNVIIGNGASSPTFVAPSSSGNVLTSNGTTWTSAAPATSGTVTAVSVASTNGFAGTSSGGATPALTLSTSITGVLKGNGTAISAATAGTDYVAPSGALGTPSSGTLSACTVDGTDAVGFRNIPVNSQSADYTLVLADSGKTILHPASDANARTFTIPANSSVAYPIGTAVTFINMTSQVVTIAITTDTMYLSDAGTTGSRSLAQYGSATAIKITSTNWLISGSGLT